MLDHLLLLVVCCVLLLALISVVLSFGYVGLFFPYFLLKKKVMKMTGRNINSVSEELESFFSRFFPPFNKHLALH